MLISSFDLEPVCNLRVSAIDLYNQLEKLCLTSEVCGHCSQTKCLTGFSIEMCKIILRNKKILIIRNGRKYIPYEDTRQYSKDQLIQSIAHTLALCNNCSGEHNDNCVINLIRLALNKALTGKGDRFDYKGNTMLYIMNLTNFYDNNVGIELLNTYTHILTECAEN